MLAALADEARIDWLPKGNAMTGEGSLHQRSVILALPLTYVNRSGEAVAALLRKYSLTEEELLVILDDLHLPEGKLRLRSGGSAAGHNGMQDIIDRLGTQDIARIRVGIGSDFPKGGQSDYVLSPFTAEQRPVMDEAVEEAVQAIRVYVSKGLTAAMNTFN